MAYVEVILMPANDVVSHAQRYFQRIFNYTVVACLTDFHLYICLHDLAMDSEIELFDN